MHGDETQIGDWVRSEHQINDKLVLFFEKFGRNYSTYVVDKSKISGVDGKLFCRFPRKKGQKTIFMTVVFRDQSQLDHFMETEPMHGCQICVTRVQKIIICKKHSFFDEKACIHRKNVVVNYAIVNCGRVFKID